MEHVHVNRERIPDQLLSFRAEQWKGRDETTSFNRWRDARRKWADKHGWHTTQETRLLEEKHLGAEVLQRRLAASSDVEERAAALREYHADHVQGLRSYREQMWREVSR